MNLQDNTNVVSTISPHSGRADLLRAAALIVWDELPAANVAAVECADTVCKLITGRMRPFGGIPFVGLGDFRQVAPVVTGQGCAPALQASIKSSLLWNEFQIRSLTRSLRGANDPEYTRLVDLIGENWHVQDDDLSMLDRVYAVDDSITFLFPGEMLKNPNECLKRAFLSPLNEDVDRFNASVLANLNTAESTCSSNNIVSCSNYLCIMAEIYYSCDSIEEDPVDADDHPELDQDFLELLTHNGIPPHALHLKEGCVCLLMRNLSVRKGSVKNTRLIVNKLHQRFVEVHVINNRTGLLGETHCIPRIRFKFTPARSGWTVIRCQLPLRLAYATTFNGCVGLTLNRTILDLRTNVFAHGQLYTALSRVRRRQDSKIFLPESAVEPITKNVVYRPLLFDNTPS